jgi:hypothetical protein
MIVQVERLWKFMTKGLDFGLGLWKLHKFTLCPAQDSNHIFDWLCIIFSPFLWTLKKVWPFNPTDSRLGPP